MSKAIWIGKVVHLLSEMMIDRTVNLKFGERAKERIRELHDTAPTDFQTRVWAWMEKAFLPTLYEDKTERADRFLEEAIEFLQSIGYDRSRIATLVDYVYSRPVGEPPQEAGGTMVTLAALCWVHDIRMDDEGERELARIMQPEVIEKIRLKQAAKAEIDFDTPVPGLAFTPRIFCFSDDAGVVFAEVVKSHIELEDAVAMWAFDTHWSDLSSDWIGEVSGIVEDLLMNGEFHPEGDKPCYLHKA